MTAEAYDAASPFRFLDTEYKGLPPTVTENPDISLEDLATVIEMIPPVVHDPITDPKEVAPNETSVLHADIAIESSGQKLSSLVGKFDKDKARLAVLNGRMINTNLDINGLETKNGELEASTAESFAKRSEMEQVVLGKQAEVRRLHGELDPKQAEYDAMQKYIDDVQAKNNQRNMQDPVNIAEFMQTFELLAGPNVYARDIQDLSGKIADIEAAIKQLKSVDIPETVHTIFSNKMKREENEAALRTLRASFEADEAESVLLRGRVDAMQRFFTRVLQETMYQLQNVYEDATDEEEA